MDFGQPNNALYVRGVKYIAKYADGEEKEPWGYEVIKEETVIQGGEERKSTIIEK